MTLLACLLLNANRAVSGDTIADAGLGIGAGSRSRLQMAVARLRRSLEALAAPGEQVIRTVRGGYMIVAAPGQLDAEIFESRVARGGRSARSSRL